MKGLRFPAILVATVVMAGFGVPAVLHAQMGFVAVVEDPSFSDCQLDDLNQGFTSLYVVHFNTVGATSARFRVVDNGNCAYIGYVPAANVSISGGGPFSGMTATYAGCSTGTFLVLTLDYFCSGDTPACSTFVVEADPGSGTTAVEIVDCGAQTAMAGDRTAYWNPDAGCGCSSIVPAAETSWGRLKALYEG